MHSPAPENDQVIYVHLSRSFWSEKGESDLTEYEPHLNAIGNLVLTGEGLGVTKYELHFNADHGRFLFNKVDGDDENETFENIDNVVDAHLGGIWYDTNEQLRKELNWESKIDMPFSTLGLIDQLIAEHRGHQGLGNDMLGFYGLRGTKVFKV